MRLRRPTQLGPLACVLVLQSVAGAQNAGEWTLTTSDFSSMPVKVQSIDAGGVTLAGEPGKRVAMDQVLDLSSMVNSPAKTARFALCLTDGDTIAGEPVSVADEVVTWKGSTVGEVKIPLRDMLAVAPADGVRAGPHAGAVTEDVVHLSNGDVVRGVMTGLDSAGATMTVNGDATPVPLASIARIDLAQTGSRPAPAGSARFRVRLVDGSQLTGPAPVGGSEKFDFNFAGAARTLKGSDVLSIEQLDGPVSWLGTREPLEQVQIPHLPGRDWPARTDRAVDGSPIRFGNRTYAHGIGVHAYSRLTYALDGSYKTFRTQYAIAGDAPYADVTVRILIDGRTVHETSGFRAGVLSDVVRVDVSSGKQLTLEVDYGAGNDVQDRFNWIEPALVK